MIRKVLATILLVFGCLTLQAQQSLALKAKGTFFEDSVSGYKGWSNSNGDNFTKANYRYYNGVTYILMKPEQDMSVTFTCEAAVKKGTLDVIFLAGETPAEELSFDGNATKTAVITLKKGETYKVMFKGNETKGSYKCSWVTTAI